MATNRIKISLESFVRDFIVETLDLLISKEALRALKKAKDNKYGYISCSIDRFDIEQMIGELSRDANHSTDPDVVETACMAAEILEIYI
ncbi:MAG: hypothetical protein PVG30_08645 [Gammaproteobacteria bacterium]|jgi:hypothetical protein